MQRYSEDGPDLDHPSDHIAGAVFLATSGNVTAPTTNHRSYCAAGGPRTQPHHKPKSQAQTRRGPGIEWVPPPFPPDCPGGEEPEAPSGNVNFLHAHSPCSHQLDATIPPVAVLPLASVCPLAQSSTSRPRTNFTLTSDI